jgi:D-methionine transport system substrate-binding protein
MKKALTALLALLFAGAAASCGTAQSPAEGGGEGAGGAAPATLKVGATPQPHAEILEQVAPALAAKGITLEIVTYTDYVQPNVAVEDGSLDANFFQHQPYLDDFNAQNGSHLVTVAKVHYEPFGLYPGRDKAVTAATLPDGGTIAVPNDATNEARALNLLEAQGVIKLKEGAGLSATKLDIAENPKNIAFSEVEAATLPHVLPDVDAAVINGNYALEAGLSVGQNAIAVEDAASEAAQLYANILVVKEGSESNPAIAELVAALNSAAVKDFINSKYDGAVVPIF